MDDLPNQGLEEHSDRFEHVCVEAKRVMEKASRLGPGGTAQWARVVLIEYCGSMVDLIGEPRFLDDPDDSIAFHGASNGSELI